MKKLLSSPVVAFLLALILIVASSLISTGLKTQGFTPEEVLVEKARFPGSWLIP